jgi:hypothetical protein
VGFERDVRMLGDVLLVDLQQAGAVAAAEQVPLADLRLAAEGTEGAAAGQSNGAEQAAKNCSTPGTRG